VRRALVGAAALLVAPAAYALLALVLGLVPVNRDFRPTQEATGGVAIYLRTNGVHAELVLPARGPENWTHEFPLLSVIDPARQRTVAGFDWIAFGWGDRQFYLETPHWRDLRARTAWRALSGQGSGAMHVEYVARPEAYRNVRIVIGEDQYRELVAYVRAGFARDAQGRPLRIDHPGYFGTDAFFEGTGSYSLRLTCNEWVRRGLARAGIRAATWAPFDVALFWQLARH
jgi:uncharacterized protein (TIGR02117 family)